jgi:hypothetical protein
MPGGGGWTPGLQIGEIIIEASGATTDIHRRALGGGAIRICTLLYLPEVGKTSQDGAKDSVARNIWT